MRRTTRLAVALLAAVSLSVPMASAGAGPAPSSPAVSGPSGRFLVGFARGVPPVLGADGTLAGLEVARVAPQAGFLVVRGTDLGAVRSSLAVVPGLTYVEPDVTMRALVTPNDPRYGSQYGPPMMGLPAAWDRAGYGSSAVMVAVIDSGIRRTHEDLTPSSRILAGYDYVGGDGDPDDTCGHGTHVSGTVGASTANGLGVAGMSAATILPLKGLDAVGGLLSVQCTGSTAGIAEAIVDAADSGADLISMSIGGGSSSTLANAVTYAWNKGVVLVAAAGNDGGSNSVDYPGAYPEVIAVAALDSSKARASYSDGGPQLDIAAPGSNVISTYNGSNTSYTSLSGTSMATPHVSGVLALALSCAPSTTNVVLRDALYRTAEDLGAPGWDSSYGHGLARADRLVTDLCGGGGGDTNDLPTAAFTSTTSGLTVSVDGSSSSDPDGDPLSYAWTFGDGSTASGAKASRTYAAGGTYTVGLTVSDGRGGSATTSRSVTVSSGGDPDPSTPTVTSGQTTTLSVSATSADHHFKIAVPAGASQLRVVLDGPSCSLLSCSLDADLYTRAGARATDTAYACSPQSGGSDETCTHASPASGYWYLRVKRYSGSGTVTLRAVVS
ncbi:MAG TPA: S8 family serine peptidase [Acidimicrobiales bacterium]|nr:S8 family serine peptidase [Acidimicrobiales bacterium]